MSLISESSGEDTWARSRRSIRSRGDAASRVEGRLSTTESNQANEAAS